MVLVNILYQSVILQHQVLQFLPVIVVFNKPTDFRAPPVELKTFFDVLNSVPEVGAEDGLLLRPSHKIEFLLELVLLRFS